MKARAVGGLAAACAIAIAVPGAANAATTAADAVSFLNKQRSLNGIGELTLDTGLSQGCANHNAYMALNGFGHGETPGNPGYTAEGAGIADKNELLVQGTHPWTETVTPWTNAPLHEYLEFDARRTRAGYAEGSGYSCLRLTGARATRSPQTYVFTGADPLSVPASVQAFDFPFAPHQLLGLPVGAITGPNMYVYVVGFGTNLHIKSATLTGPGGAVPVGSVDQRTPGGGPFFFGGGVIIPKQPLQPGGAYSTTVTWENATGTTLTQSFGFLSSGGDPVLGRLALAKAVSGRVLVKTGRRWRRLRGSSVIPIGALVDTRRGTVGLTTATGTGSQAGQFSGSIFRLLQSKDPALRGLTELKLGGGSFRRCRTRKASAAAKRSRRVVRKLKGNAKGSFRTRGRRAAATVRGTRWTVADRCDGTLTTVAGGVVDVLDIKRKRTVSVKAGQRYLAKN